MKTNDIKKGTRVLLRNGWFGTMMDNLKGNTRMVDVEGYSREIGSVYSWDIVEAYTESGDPVSVEHTDKQLAQRKMVKKLFGG